MPVTDGEEIVGSITEGQIIDYMVDHDLKDQAVRIKDIMGSPFPVVDPDTSFAKLSRVINRAQPAVITFDKAGKRHIITQYDIIQNL